MLYPEDIMDTGNKTLAQLSQEGKESRYVTLDVASKLSGYTKEYLERLCRLEKINFLLGGNGQHVLELESLLKETQTILLSYEGLTFVDKKDLTTPPVATPEALPPPLPLSDEIKQSPLITPIPHFVENGRLHSRDNSEIFSFTGRAVVSDSQHPEETKEAETHIPISVPSTLSGDHAQFSSAPKEYQEPEPSSTVPLSGKATFPEGAKGRVVLSVMREPNGEAAEIPLTPSLLNVEDDWDARLLGATEKTEDTPSVSDHPFVISLSPYHPIKTSQDATVHHEDLPLFPPLTPKGSMLSPPTTPPVALPLSTPTIELSLPPVPSAVQEVLVSPPALPPVPKMIIPHVDTALSFPQKTALTNLAPEPLPVVVPEKRANIFSAAGATYPPLPRMRVMPRVSEQESHSNLLPMNAPEHHLLPRIEMHPLAKNKAFNIAFALFLIPATLVLFGGMFSSAEKAGFASMFNVAAIIKSTHLFQEKAVFPEPSLVTPHEHSALPFSDEVIIAQGETSDVVLVQPVFREGSGSVHEYALVPLTP